MPQELSFNLPHVEQVHHLSSILVVHLEQVQVCGKPGVFVVDTFFRSASASFLVIPGGRSEVHASQERKLIGLCKVQTGQVHPSR